MSAHWKNFLPKKLKKVTNQAVETPNMVTSIDTPKTRKIEFIEYSNNKLS